MKAIKIIDLLNKIANGEEVPLKINYHGKLYIWNTEVQFYETKDKSWTLNFDTNELNDEVEIIEDKEKINIQNIIMLDLEKYCFDSTDEFAIDLTFKINELIKAIKQLDRNNKE